MSGSLQLLKRLVPAVVLAFLLGGCGTTVDWNYPRPQTTALAEPQTTTIGALFQEAADKHPAQSGFSLVREGSRAFTGRLAMADLAEKTLDAQYYIWDIDTTGRILADRLMRAADRGVRVRLLLDDHYQTEEIDVGVAAIDAHPNIEVRFFNPVANRRWRMLSFVGDFGRVNHRMHNKLFIMDNALAVAGGRNIADIYFGVRADQNFRDLDVVTAGPIVRELSASFDLFWNSDLAVPVGAVISEQATEQDYAALTAQMAERISAAGYPYPIDERIEEMRARLIEIRDAFIWGPGRVLRDDPSRASSDDGGKVIAEALYQRASETKRELLIESAYFIPGQLAIDKFQELTEHGVTVRVLTNSAATNDVVPAQAGYANLREDLLNAGVELYELRPDSDMKREWSLQAGRSRATLHSKAIVFDRESVFIGSFNLDPRSTTINTEIGVMIDSPEIAGQAAAFMDEGVAPGSAFRVSRDANDDLLWTAETNGTKVEFDTDPETSGWQRFVIGVFGILPIEEQL